MTAEKSFRMGPIVNHRRSDSQSRLDFEFFEIFSVDVRNSLNNSTPEQGAFAITEKHLHAGIGDGLIFLKGISDLVRRLPFVLSVKCVNGVALVLSQKLLDLKMPGTHRRACQFGFQFIFSIEIPAGPS